MTAPDHEWKTVVHEQSELNRSYSNPYPYLGYTPTLPQTWRRIGKLYVNVSLLVLTIASTWLTAGLWYCIAIISILMAHEMGHYLMCRKYGVPATLPYFIPFPIANPFGTMGAVISMKGYIPDRKALFDIGAAGPLAGLVVSLPVVYFGLQASQVIDSTAAADAGLKLGESLLFKGLSLLALGALEEGKDILLHPLAYAGWAGLFVTALNLLPIGQLDGGHVAYALYGENAKYVTYLFLLSLGILALIYNGYALLFALLVLFGRRHPPPWDDHTALDASRRRLGYLIFIIFVLSFTPIPFKL